MGVKRLVLRVERLVVLGAHVGDAGAFASGLEGELTRGLNRIAPENLRPGDRQAIGISRIVRKSTVVGSSELGREVGRGIVGALRR